MCTRRREAQIWPFGDSLQLLENASLHIVAAHTTYHPGQLFQDRACKTSQNLIRWEQSDFPGMSRRLPPPDPAAGFIALLLPDTSILLPLLLQYATFIASGQERAEDGEETEEHLKCGNWFACHCQKTWTRIWADPPTPFDMFPPVDGETKGLGTNCHLRDVARGFPNRVRNAREQTVEINGRRADYPSLLIHLDPVAGRGN